MKKLAVAAALSVAATLAGCSSNETTQAAPSSTTAALQGQSEAPTTSAAAASSTRTTAATTTTTTRSAGTLTVAQAQTKLEGTGFDCSAESQYVMCSKGAVNWQLKTSPKGDGDRAWITAGCDSGAIEKGTEVVTNGTLVIYAGNDGQDLDGLAEQLGGGLRVVKYC
ncbi:hypothetical protein [Tsukamurella paurometabola]|uniref:Lipoprotein n=1 Tax=Tsukamurella paurometabola TaxID=2061 RepID=A0ABS5NFW8_TSUPA|nr:hypothetical protein [Tsukamurella paurometabola]MBS4102925.1 hypothetical protein [Tsukamurella paurometabola]